MYLFNKSLVNNFGFILQIYPMRLCIHCAPTALCLNAQIMFMHSNPEESWFAPISPPWVSDNPKLCPILLSPSHYSDLMIGQWDEFDLLENSTIVVIFKFLCGINSTRNRSTSKDLGLHSLCANDNSVLFYFPSLILFLSPAVSYIPDFGRNRSFTIHTFLNVWTSEMIWIFSSICLATFFRNSMVFSIGIN